MFRTQKITHESCIKSHKKNKDNTISNRKRDILHLNWNIHASVRFLYSWNKKKTKHLWTKPLRVLHLQTLYTSICFSQSLAIILQSLYNIKQNSIIFISIHYIYTHFEYAMNANPKDVLRFFCMYWIVAFYIKILLDMAGWVDLKSLLLYFTIRDVIILCVLSVSFSHSLWCFFFFFWFHSFVFLISFLPFFLFHSFNFYDYLITIVAIDRNNKNKF